jgi:hypothetical protein
MKRSLKLLTPCRQGLISPEANASSCHESFKPKKSFVTIFRLYSTKPPLNILSQFRSDYTRGSDWSTDLLTTYTHHSELEAIIAPSLISTLYKTPQHPLSLFQPDVSSLAFPLQRLLRVEILQLHAFSASLAELKGLPTDNTQLTGSPQFCSV